MITFLYNLLAAVSIPFVVCYHLYRSLSRGRSPAFTQRFGFIEEADLAAIGGDDVIWLHAVSVGETIAATPLIKALRQRFPHRKIVISNVTETGREVARKIAGVDLCIYFPFDYPFAVAGALRRIRPSLVLIMETELWPNFISKAHAAGIPTVLVNGRISDRSFRRYLRLSWFFGPYLRQLSVICMQSAEDARRIVAIGARQDQVQVTRNLKYDIAVSPQSLAERQQLKSFYTLPESAMILTAGSTHEGEEELIVAAYQALLAAGHNAFLVLVPRHPERARQVAATLTSAGVNFRLRSALQEGQILFAPGQVLLVDTVGELLKLYGVSDLVFVGGSLVPTGGHNVLEPAALGVPVLFGPHMDNFREISSLVLSTGAGLQVQDATELKEKMAKLLTDAGIRQRMGENGVKLVEDNSGAAARNLAVVEQLIQ